MIIVPRVLAELLRAADDELQKSLALDFAQHAVQECRDGIDSYEVYNSYLAAARAFLGGQGSIDQLEEHRKEFHAYWQRSDLSGAVGTPVQLAVLMVCWHDLKATRTVILSKKPPSLIDIAREAQSVVGAWAAARRAKAEEDGSVVARRARWEEARWQLIHTIELSPNPTI